MPGRQGYNKYFENPNHHKTTQPNEASTPRKNKKMKKEAKLGKIKTPSLHSTETKPEKKHTHVANQQTSNYRLTKKRRA